MGMLARWRNTPQAPEAWELAIQLPGVRVIDREDQLLATDRPEAAAALIARALGARRWTTKIAGLGDLGGGGVGRDAGTHLPQSQ